MSLFYHSFSRPTRWHEHFKLAFEELSASFPGVVEICHVHLNPRSPEFTLLQFDFKVGLRK